MLELLQTSGPWWRGSEALNVTETDHVKGHVGNTMIGEIWSGVNQASRRNEIILQKRLHERFTGGENYGATSILSCWKLTLGLMFFRSCLQLYSLPFAFCFQADKDGTIELL